MSVRIRGESEGNLRGVIKALDRLYPGLGEHLEEETTVAIDGAIHETAYYQPIREGREIFFIPKLEGDNPPGPARLGPHIQDLHDVYVACADGEAVRS